MTISDKHVYVWCVILLDGAHVLLNISTSSPMNTNTLRNVCYVTNVSQHLVIHQHKSNSHPQSICMELHILVFPKCVCVNNSHSKPHCHSHIRIHIRLTSRCNVLSDTDADEEWQRQWWRSCRRMQWMRVQTRVKELSNAHMSVQSRRQRHIETCEYFIILLINGHYVPPHPRMHGWLNGLWRGHLHMDVW